ncbi:MAG: hypothetical protein IIC75_03430 [Bacteroidetes bacterium]|nr:hypothetical protein [Bacteroidota bacterium]
MVVIVVSDLFSLVRLLGNWHRIIQKETTVTLINTNKQNSLMMAFN